MTDPFRYFPHPLVRQAAEEVIRRISGSKTLSEAFSEGKMLGILITNESPFTYIAAFSGNVGGKSHIEGFVPPIFDLTVPGGYFKLKEAEITEINDKIKNLESSNRLHDLNISLLALEKERDEEISFFRYRMGINKKKRDELRNETSDPSQLAMLIKESQQEKAELRRAKIRWEERICQIKNEREKYFALITDLKAQRAIMSDELQKWIFNQYVVHNALGEEKSIYEIFNSQGMTPPGGTGECAAPKLLEYAYRKGMTPIAMGEFWYGQSPQTAVRTHGHFYPSCTSKCGPLLGFMLKGLYIDSSYRTPDDPKIIFEDDYIVVASKPSGMPSVPGLDGKRSLLEWLKTNTGSGIISVHRLDMDTSGVMVFAKDAVTAVAIQKQFENHTIRKTYMARLSPAKEGRPLKEGETGCIELPLNPDYDERPRQKVDMLNGKASLTEYEICKIHSDGSTDIMFYPKTGRTHQLRVHSAHTLGLGRPILGDMLYGGAFSERLHLHAYKLSFQHPADNILMEFSDGI